MSIAQIHRQHFDGKIIRHQIYVPYNAKIADITHADTNLHTLTLANAGGTGAIAGERRKIISISLAGIQIAGAGALYVFPNEQAGGGNYCYVPSWGNIPDVVLADGTQRLQYSLSVAGNDWDLYCIGYVVEA